MLLGSSTGLGFKICRKTIRIKESRSRRRRNERNEHYNLRVCRLVRDVLRHLFTIKMILRGGILSKNVNHYESDTKSVEK